MKICVLVFFFNITCETNYMPFDMVAIQHLNASTTTLTKKIVGEGMRVSRHGKDEVSYSSNLTMQLRIVREYKLHKNYLPTKFYSVMVYHLHRAS